MSTLNETSQFDDVYQIEKGDKAVGGPGGTANKQAQQLANRTRWLKDNIPTPAGKAAADGATATPTAAKVPIADASGLLDSWVSDASTTTKGKAQLGASGGAPKLVEYPDETAALVSILSFSDTAGWLTAAATLSIVNGALRITATGASTYSGTYRPGLTTSYGNCVVFLVRASRKMTLKGYTGNNEYGEFVVNEKESLVTIPQTFVIATIGLWQPSGTAISGDWFEILKVWIGNYAYLPGSKEIEALRLENQLALSSGCGAFASGTIVSNGTNVTGGNKIAISGYSSASNAYKFVSALTSAAWEVLIGSTPQETFQNLVYAINEGPEGAHYGITHYSQKVHSQVAAALGNLTITLKATLEGTIGNKIVLATNEPTIQFPSGSYLVGGIDAVGGKIKAQLQTLPCSTAEYGAAKLAGDADATAGLAVNANDSRLISAPTSWTPVPKFGGINDDGTFSISYNKVVKSGKKLSGNCAIVWTAKGTKTGAFTIGGLPYASTGGDKNPVGILVPYSGFSGLTAGIHIIVTTDGSTTLRFQKVIATETIDALTDANFTSSTILKFHFEMLLA